jgi:hypothetical protein
MIWVHMNWLDRNHLWLKRMRKTHHQHLSKLQTNIRVIYLRNFWIAVQSNLSNLIIVMIEIRCKYSSWNLTRHTKLFNPAHLLTNWCRNLKRVHCLDLYMSSWVWSRTTYRFEFTFAYLAIRIWKAKKWLMTRANCLCSSRNVPINLIGKVQRW